MSGNDLWPTKFECSLVDWHDRKFWPHFFGVELERFLNDQHSQHYPADNIHQKWRDRRLNAHRLVHMPAKVSEWHRIDMVSQSTIAAIHSAFVCFAGQTHFNLEPINFCGQPLEVIHCYLPKMASVLVGLMGLGFKLKLCLVDAVYKKLSSYELVVPCDPCDQLEGRWNYKIVAFLTIL